MTAARHAELLAPAGEPRALRAALAAGADAVYFGLERWSARAFAGNFAGDAAVAAVELAHLYDARALQRSRPKYTASAPAARAARSARGSPAGARSSAPRGGVVIGAAGSW